MPKDPFIGWVKIDFRDQFPAEWFWNYYWLERVEEKRKKKDSREGEVAETPPPF